MRRLIIVTASMFAASCQNSAEKAEGDYEFLKKNGASNRELCAAADRVAGAHLERRDDSEYQMWTITRDLHCNADRLDALEG